MRFERYGKVGDSLGNRKGGTKDCKEGQKRERKKKKGGKRTKKKKDGEREKRLGNNKQKEEIIKPKSLAEWETIAKESVNLNKEGGLKTKVKRREREVGRTWSSRRRWE